MGAFVRRESIWVGVDAEALVLPDDVVVHPLDNECSLFDFHLALIVWHLMQAAHVHVFLLELILRVARDHTAAVFPRLFHVLEVDLGVRPLELLLRLTIPLDGFRNERCALQRQVYRRVDVKFLLLHWLYNRYIHLEPVLHILERFVRRGARLRDRLRVASCHGESCHGLSGGSWSDLNGWA